MFHEAGVTNHSDYRAPDGGGSCGFVEFLLPTFVWQHYAHLISHSSPPTVRRCWGALGATSHTHPHPLTSSPLPRYCATGARSAP